MLLSLSENGNKYNSFFKQTVYSSYIDLKGAR